MLEERFWSLMTVIMFAAGLFIGVWLGITVSETELKTTLKALRDINLKTTRDSTILYRDSLIMERCYESLNFKFK